MLLLFFDSPEFLISQGLFVPRGYVHQFWDVSVGTVTLKLRKCKHSK